MGHWLIAIPINIMTEINKSMSHRAPKKEIIWCLSENNYSRLTSTTRWFEDPSLTLPWLTPPYSWLMLTENLRKWFLPYFGLGYLNSIGSVFPETYLSLGQKSENSWVSVPKPTYYILQRIHLANFLWVVLRSTDWEFEFRWASCPVDSSKKLLL